MLVIEQNSELEKATSVKKQKPHCVYYIFLIWIHDLVTLTVTLTFTLTVAF